MYQNALPSILILVQINANVNLINAICVYPEFTHLSTSTFLSRNRQGNVNSFCIVQFSRSFFLTLSFWSLRRLCYYITSFRVCQEVFQKFFWSFLDFLSFRCDLGSFACLVSQAFLLYHIFSSLSRGFSKFIFEPLFKPSRSDLTVCRLSRSSLFIISLCFRFVKRFFKLFWSFFLIFDHFVMFSSRSRDSFYIILSLFEKVNPFFKNIQKILHN